MQNRQNSAKVLYYAKVLKVKAPNRLYSYVRLAQVYYDKDEYKKCMQIIEEAKKIDPENKVIRMYERPAKEALENQKRLENRSE